MAQGVDIRITDVPFSSVPDHEAKVFINDAGKLRQTDLTTIAKYSQLYELIIQAHEEGLLSLQQARQELGQALIDLAAEKFEMLNADHAENLAELTQQYELYMQSLERQIADGHAKLEKDVNTVDDLRTYAAMINTVTGTRECVLKDPIPGPVLFKNMSGSSYQRVLSGKNLVLGTNLSFDANTTATKPVTEDILLEAGTYTLSWTQSATMASNTRNTPQCNLSNGTTIYESVSANHNLAAGRKSWTFTLDKTDRVTFSFWVHTASTAVSITDFQLEVGAVATDYEPFCGRVPSPSPSFPQMIESVGDNGWFDGEWSSGGLQVADGAEFASTDYMRSNKIKCKENDIIRFDCRNTEIGTRIFFYNDTSFISAAYNATGDSYVEKTAPSSATYFRLVVYKGSVNVNDVKNSYVTINGTYALKIKETGKSIFAFSTESNYSGSVAITVNADKSITLKGTATARVVCYLCKGLEKRTLPKGSYVFSIGNVLPSGCGFLFGQYKESGVYDKNIFSRFNGATSAEFTLEEEDIADLYFKELEFFPEGKCRCTYPPCRSD